MSQVGCCSLELQRAPRPSRDSRCRKPWTECERERVSERPRPRALPHLGPPLFRSLSAIKYIRAPAARPRRTVAGAASLPPPRRLLAASSPPPCGPCAHSDFDTDRSDGLASKIQSGTATIRGEKASTSPLSGVGKNTRLNAEEGSKSLGSVSFLKDKERTKGLGRLARKCGRDREQGRTSHGRIRATPIGEALRSARLGDLPSRLPCQGTGKRDTRRRKGMRPLGNSGTPQGRNIEWPA
jgi:hypothetical protein